MEATNETSMKGAKSDKPEIHKKYEGFFEPLSFIYLRGLEDN
jgi:hypothetical protein